MLSHVGDEILKWHRCIQCAYSPSAHGLLRIQAGDLTVHDVEGRLLIRMRCNESFDNRRAHGPWRDHLQAHFPDTFNLALGADEGIRPAQWAELAMAVSAKRTVAVFVDSARARLKYGLRNLADVICRNLHRSGI